MKARDENSVRLREELERRILHGIACEWESALWVLNDRVRERMRPPLFQLEEMTGRWGFWSGRSRVVCLSRKLVLDHPWDSVREVLLHEMAHQLAEEVLGAGNEPPHGPSFLKAARLLRADPAASGDFRLLDERLAAPPSREEKILVWVKKLLALAESRNRHEAEAAMAKAHELVETYNLDLLKHDRKRGFVSRFLGKPALRHPREYYHLARLLQDFYFVHGLWVSAYVIEKGKMGRVLEINGTVQNTHLASYVHDFVLGFIQSEWNRYNEGRGLDRHRRTDFAVGVIEGFHLTLTSQRKAREKGRSRVPLLPATLKDPLLKEYVDYRYPHTTTFRRRAQNQDDRIFGEGIRVGRRLVIHQGVTERGGNGGLLTGGSD
jgi:hypothetical protein